MGENTSDHTRRDVIRLAGAAGAAGLAGMGATGTVAARQDDYPPLGNYPIDGDTATFGFTVPLSGPYSSEGEDELRAYRLAVEHLNNGGGWVDNWEDLSGNGVLDYEIDFVQGDTATDADTARQTAQRMIQRDGVIMVTGGSSSATAIAMQELCQQQNVQFMCCLTHSNDTTGQNCVRYSFREVFNAYMTAQALVPPVTEEYGTDNQFYQLYADYTWGQTQQESMREFFSEAGWSQLDSVATPLGTSDFSTFLSNVPDDADVLFLNHYGLDGANSLSQAIDMGLDENVEIIMPLYNRPMAQAAGGAIEGIYGTVAWDAQLDNEPSQTFAEVFGEAYDGRTPSGPAQLAYAQTLQYAAAVERAGTFYPPEVIRQLEDYEYDNIGMGPEIMRACDHQAMRAVPVVKGLPEEEQEEGTFFEIVNVTGRDQVGYGCDEGPAAECDLGSYE